LRNRLDHNESYPGAPQKLAVGSYYDNPAAVTQVPLEFVDDTLGFNPEWVANSSPHGCADPAQPWLAS